MGDIAVRVDGLSKCFKLNVVPNLTLEEAVHRRIGRLKSQLNAIRHDICSLQWPQPNRFLPQPRQDFWALKDISFELMHGEVMGIIGANGAGKSTLLKILSQVLAPSEGRVELHGHVGALLEVGTGFNPELTGRENIYLYGSILGMSRIDISRRFDEIVAFAEIERFLDQPIKNYSSGMHSRLAFSVAAHLECDILLVDEVLSVGDAAFRSKCLGKMEDVTGQGRAVIFVSHNMSAIRNMCSSALWLENGRIKYSGETTDVIEEYMGSVSKDTNMEINNPVNIVGNEDKEIRIIEVYIKDNTGNYNREIEYIDNFTIGMKVAINEPSRDYYNAIWLQDSSGNIIIFSTDEDTGQSLISQQARGVYEFNVTFPARLFNPGDYRVMWATCRQRKGQVDRHDNLIPLSIKDTHTWRGQRNLYRRSAAIAPELEWVVNDIGNVVPNAKEA